MFLLRSASPDVMLHLKYQNANGKAGVDASVRPSGDLFFEERLPRNLVRLIYFDEAGIGSIDKEPITTVSAVAIHADREIPFVNAKV